MVPVEKLFACFFSDVPGPGKDRQSVPPVGAREDHSSVWYKLKSFLLPFSLTFRGLGKTGKVCRRQGLVKSAAVYGTR